MAAALDRHVALVGFMGAGKTTVGEAVAKRIGRPFVDLDRELERHLPVSLTEFFTTRGETEFRLLEAKRALELLRRPERSVIALGGGALGSEQIRGELRRQALTVHLQVGPQQAWERVRSSDRPLAQSEEHFRALYAERLPVYREAADAAADDADDVVLAAAGVRVESGSLASLAEVVPSVGKLALVTDANVARLYGHHVSTSFGARLGSRHQLPAGEEAKTLEQAERLWRALRLERGDTLVALGGGCVTDATGFVASTYLRGLAWIAVPTTLVGQVDAAIGGKTAINLPEGKNLVGSFHWPVQTLLDPELLGTLPEGERTNGLAEVVKASLLAGERLWELPEPELVRRSAAYKAGVALADPFDRGDRAVLNLGHTFAHALEAGGVASHGAAVALGLGAALRLSVEHRGLDRAVADEVAAVLPTPQAHADLDRAWAAMQHDKKVESGTIRLVLLDAPGRPVAGVELPEDVVHNALAELVSE